MLETFRYSGFSALGDYEVNEVLLEIGNLFSPGVVQERELLMQSTSLQTLWSVDSSVLMSE